MEYLIITRGMRVMTMMHDDHEREGGGVYKWYSKWEGRKEGRKEQGSAALAHG